MCLPQHVKEEEEENGEPVNRIADENGLQQQQQQQPDTELVIDDDDFDEDMLSSDDDDDDWDDDDVDNDVWAAFNGWLETFTPHEIQEMVHVRGLVGSLLMRCRERIATFADNWPHNGRPNQTSPEMAEAGFFRRDNTTFDDVECRYCGVVLGDWEETDIPMLEHIRVSPQCPFVNQFPLGYRHAIECPIMLTRVSPLIEYPCVMPGGWPFRTLGTPFDRRYKDVFFRTAELSRQPHTIFPAAKPSSAEICHHCNMANNSDTLDCCVCGYYEDYYCRHCPPNPPELAPLPKLHGLCSTCARVQGVQPVTEAFCDHKWNRTPISRKHISSPVRHETCCLIRCNILETKHCCHCDKTYYPPRSGEGRMDCCCPPSDDRHLYANCCSHECYLDKDEHCRHCRN